MVSSPDRQADNGRATSALFNGEPPMLASKHVPFAALFTLLIVSAGTAQEPKPAPLDRKSLDERAAKMLRAVYHEGAVELYNQGHQSAAAYYFQGALVAVEPFLDHHPELQRVVVRGLANARKVTDLDDRA